MRFFLLSQTEEAGSRILREFGSRHETRSFSHYQRGVRPGFVTAKKLVLVLRKVELYAIRSICLFRSGNIKIG